MLNQLCTFIINRERARLWRETHEALGPHGTAASMEQMLDPIIRKFRFCNINREHDKVTRWIARNIRWRFEADPHLWFALIVARLINQPHTLENIYEGQGASWNRERFLDNTDPRLDNPQPIWNAAYIVSTNGNAMEKRFYIADRVLQPIWDAYTDSFDSDVAPTAPFQYDNATCQAWADWLLRFDGMGDFMVNQIVTDYKYTRLCRDAEDRSTFVMAGPGTIRGLNRYHGRPVDQGLNRAKAKGELLTIREELASFIPTAMLAYFEDLNNLSNTFCEFDKYLRAKTGEGRPKQLYQPS
jgi:hypothetical protein